MHILVNDLLLKKNNLLIITSTYTCYRQGEIWAMLRNKLTPELTSPRTIQRFLPEVNQLADDFINLISQARDSNNVVEKFESYCNRMGLESMFNWIVVVVVI